MFRNGCDTHFPGGGPGVSLLVLRVCIATALAGIAFPTGWKHLTFLVLLSLLCLGLMTPAVCALAVIAVLLDLTHVSCINVEEVGIVLLSTSSYAFLGPGAYSIDARLFGRRVIVSTDFSHSGRDDEA
jgi:hypothetical protein